MADSRARTRAGLLPDEKQAGSDDPLGQAEAIIEESDDRTDDPEPDEERTSDEATPPVD